MKKLGILGGMGPLAGAYFFLRFSQLTAAQRDDGNPEAVLYSASGIPDRTAWLTGRGESPLPALLRGTAFLCDSGAEVLVMACNTAYAFFSELREASGGRLLNMPELAVFDAVSHGAGRIGVLSTTGCASAGIYRAACLRAGVEYVPLSSRVQEVVNEKIYRKKAGEDITPEAFLLAARELMDAGADHVILGCTEISAVMGGGVYPALTDALETTARAAVVACGAVCHPKLERRSHDFCGTFV